MWRNVMSQVAKLKKKEVRIPVPWGHVSGIAWGNPEDKKVLMAHGSQDNAESFTKLIQYLPQNYFYLSIDLPGHGLSSHFQSGTVIHFLDLVLALRHVLDELQWNNCLYLGHSLGGQVGAVHSIIYPGTFEKLVTIDAFMCLTYPKDKILKRIKTEYDVALEEARKPEPLYTREEAFERLWKKRSFKIPQEAAEILFDRSVTKIGDKYKFNRDSRLKPIVSLHYNFETTVEFLKSLRTPTLLLLATDSIYDALKQRHVLETYKKTAPDFLTIKDMEGNHELHANNPQAVASHVTAFFEDTARSKL